MHHDHEARAENSFLIHLKDARNLLCSSTLYTTNAIVIRSLDLTLLLNCWKSIPQCEKLDYKSFTITNHASLAMSS